MQQMNMTIKFRETGMINNQPVKLLTRPTVIMEERLGTFRKGYYPTGRSFWKPLTIEIDCESMVNFAFSKDVIEIILQADLEKWTIGKAHVIDFNDNVVTILFEDVRYEQPKELTNAQNS